MKWLWVVAGVLLAALGTAYWQLPWILQTLITEQAAARGVEVDDLSIQRPRWGLISIERAEFRFGSNDIRVEQMTIGFTLASVMDAKATDIFVAKLKISTLSDDSDPAATVAVAAGVPETAPEVLAASLLGLWSVLPVESIAAPEILVELADLSLSAAVQFSHPSASLWAEIHEGAKPDNRVEVNTDLANARGSAAVTWQSDLGSDLAPMQVSVAGLAPFVLSDTGWQLEAGLTATVAALDWRISFDVGNAQGLWQAEPDKLARITGRWQGSVQSDPTLVSALGSLWGELGEAGILLGLGTDTVVNADRLSGQDWNVDTIHVALRESAQVQVQTAPPGYRLLGPAMLSVQLEGAGWSEFESNPSLEVSIETLTGDLESMDALAQLQIPSLQLAGTVRIASRLPAGPFAVDFDTDQRLSQPLLASLLTGDPQDYDLNSGRIRTRGSLGTNNESGELGGSIELSVAGLRAHYQDVTLRGINGDFTLALSAQDGKGAQGGWRLGPDRLQIAHIDVGFPVTELAARVTLTSEHLQLTNLVGQTLGGDVAVAKLSYDIVNESSEFMLHATGVELAQVLALEGETISGSGILDGQLPLQLAAQQVRVRTGRFAAREPGGVLRYGGAEEAAASLGQPGVGFAIAALGNFRYQVLNVEVDYEPNGDLLLGVHLQGRNPEFEAGRPIHYNLNISENIPVLLQSLRISDEVGRRLEQRLIP